MSKEGSGKMKWIKRVLCLTLAFTMIITALPTVNITETVYAKEGNNGTGGGTQGAGGDLHGGPTESKQGYRIYLMTKSKKTLSKVYDCYFNFASVSVGHYERDTRLGNKDATKAKKITPQVQQYFGIPKAFYYSNGSFHGNGVAFKKWASKHKRYYSKKERKWKTAILRNIDFFAQWVVGKETYEKARERAGDDVYVVVEPLAWHSVLPKKSSKLNGQTILATGYEYLNFNAEHGFGSNTRTKILDNFILQYCMVLQRNEMGLTKVDTHKKGLSYVTKSGLGKKGLSLHLYSLTPEKDAIDSTCTYDENYDSHYKPEKAPNKVTGTADEKEKKKEAYKVTIVKTYRVKKINLDGDVKYIDKGTFVRKYNPSTIDIENEPKTKIQYHVIGYQTTDKVKKSINALKWKSIMKNKKLTGNATKSKLALKPNNEAVITKVTLHKKIEKQRDPKTHKKKTIRHKYDEIVLYVLLQKEQKEKPISGDYTLKQSQISKKVDLYKTEKGKNILKNHSFVWDSSALNDACGGHTYYCGDENCSGHTYSCSWSLADTSLSLAIMNARYRADEYKYNIAYKAWDDEWTDTEVANQC